MVDMRKIGLFLTAAVIIASLAGCNAQQTPEQLGTPNSTLLGEVSEVKKNVISLKELDGAGRMFMQGSGANVSGGGGGIYRREGGGEAGAQQPDGEGTQRIIRRPEDGGTSGIQQNGDPNRTPPPMRYTGYVKNVTVPGDLKVASFSFDGDQPVETTVEVSDLKAGDVVVVTYDAQGKPSNIMLTPQRMRRGGED